MTAQVDLDDRALLDHVEVSPDRPDAVVRRRLAAVAAGGVGLCMLAIGLLHVLPAERGLNPVSAPISNYALTPAGWLFDAAVIILAVGLVALLCALVSGGWLATASEPFALLTVCCLSLVTLVIFPNRMSHGVLTTACRIHWGAAMVTFAGLPLAAVLVARRHDVRLGCSGLPGLIWQLSAVASVCFAIYFAGGVVELSSPVRFWPVGGALERALALTDMLIAVVLAAVARQSCACRPDLAPTAGRS